MRSTRDGFGEAIYELVAAQKEVVVMTADLAASLRLEKVKADFPDQFVECGICEQNMVSAAAGIAMTGKKVVTAGFASFHPGRSWEQIRVACEQNLNVKIVGSHAGLATGPDGATHQALEDIALMSCLPEMKVYVPADYTEAKIYTNVLVNTDGPGYLRLSREPTADLPASDEWTPGQARVWRDGDDAVIFACGLTVPLALQVAKQLKKDADLHVGVVSLASLVPLDEQTVVEYASSCGAVVTIEEHQLTGGMGQMVAAYLARQAPVVMEMVGIEGKFGQSGSREELWERYGLNEQNLREHVLRAIERKIDAGRAED